MATENSSNRSIVTERHAENGVPLQALAIGIAVFAVIVRVWVAKTTHSTAEDYLISLRYAENIARGNGFVYNIGERVLGTTTPLYTLMLAGAAWLHLDVTWFGKFCNILADGGTCYLLARLPARPEIGRPKAGLFAALLYALTSTPINISISGMETGLVTCAVVAAILAYVARRTRVLYILMAILFLLRVDTLLLSAILAVSLALWERRIPWLDVLLGKLLALPWVVFAFIYFGSPIPTSLIAKVTVYKHGITPDWINVAAFKTQFTDGPVQALLTLLFVIGLAWVVLNHAPGTKRVAADLTQNPPSTSDNLSSDSLSSTDTEPTAKAAFTQTPNGVTFGLRIALGPPLLWLLVYYGMMFVSHVPAFAWYFLPPWPLFLGTAALGASAVLDLIGKALPASTSTALSRIWPLALLAVGILGARHIRSIRADIAKTQWQETVLRKPMGLWLHDHVRPNERILLEPIGYVGYYSQRPILDMIGLVSPEVIPAYHTPAPLAGMVRGFRPAWLCLRPQEARVLERDYPGVLQSQYVFVRDFTVPGRGPAFLLYHLR